MSDLAEILASTPWLLAACVFLVSLLVGSFLNVVIHRVPIMLEREWQAHAREMLAEPARADDAGAVSDRTDRSRERYNLLVPRSRCPQCNARITALQNIPVFSWLLLGGKCASCGGSISVRYPVVEFVTAVLSTAVAMHFGPHWQTLAALLFTWALISLTVIDLDHTLLPDIITIPLLWLGLLLSLCWHAGLRAPAPTDPSSAILGAVSGYLILWTVYWVFKLATGKEGMGYGDFKLLGALGAWMGWQMLPLILLFSAFAGAVIGIALILLRGRDRNVPIPFGPYLAAAGWIALLWGPQIMGGYLTLAGLRH
ncbi:MAG: A24 family peptidase [Gammaproteobacteria bacterium]|nr:A24 family peptidase [Gammaproteobacteria bacterium]MDH4256227.1 A24 family peptidase [Gammaproteobacteria bacterium]MDH5272061.1 A24 family peptidase [Gammaproteobacteria bacterium]